VAATVLHRPIRLQVTKNHARVKERDFRYPTYLGWVWSNVSLYGEVLAFCPDAAYRQLGALVCIAGFFFRY
jgi:hypothetical protein